MTGPAKTTPKIIIITGPTASGKTAFSLEIANRINGEIINADVGQFYQPLSIGTAKPDLKATQITHHLFDIAQTPININVTTFKSLVMQSITDICARGKIPILVGGSLFYIKSLFFPPLDLVPLQNTPAIDVEALYAKTSHQELWDILNTIDPDRAAKLYVQDRYRVLRALYLWHTFGKKPSECLPQFKPDFDAMIIFIAPEQIEHKKNIEVRTRQMLNEGWIEESKTLIDTEWELFLEKKGLIGYSDIFTWLKSDKHFDQKKALVTTIAQKTWQYARRQNIFWASFKRELSAAAHNNKNRHILEIIEVQNAHKIIDKVYNFVKSAIK